MIDSPFFDLNELVCPHVFQKYGVRAWEFFDPRIIILINTIRDRIGKAIFINSWEKRGDLIIFPYGTQFKERGLRCPQCYIPKGYAAQGILNMSAHALGKGFDFDVQGLLAGEVREWIIKNQNWWPYSLRMEDNVNWCHLDLFNSGEKGKVILFNK